MTIGVKSQSCYENLLTRPENKFQKATLCAIWFATKLSFPKRFHCDLEALFFQVLNCAVQHVFWAEKHAQLWSLCNFCLSLGKKEIWNSFFSLRNWSIGVSSSDCKKHEATLWSLLSRFILRPQVFSFVFPNVPFRLRRQRKKAEMKFWEVGSYALRCKLLIYIGKWQRALSQE